MTIVTKREPENPWDGVKLIVGVKRFTLLIIGIVHRIVIFGVIPFEVKNQNEFTQKVEAIRDKNVFLKAMAVQENREIYTQKFITKL